MLSDITHSIIDADITTCLVLQKSYISQGSRKGRTNQDKNDKSIASVITVETEKAKMVTAMLI